MGRLHLNLLLLLSISLFTVQVNGQWLEIKNYFRLFGDPVCNVNTQWLGGVSAYPTCDGKGNVLTLTVLNIGGSSPLAMTPQLANHPTLDTLYFANIQKGITFPTSDMTNMTGLRNVNISVNTISPSTVFDFSKATSLQTLLSLKLSTNFILQSALKTNVNFPLDFTVFTKIPSLKYLFLNGLTANPTEFMPIASINWPSLISLELIGSGFNGTMDPKFFYLPSLKSFTVVNSPLLTFEIPNNLYDGSLTTLNITNTNCGGTLPVNIINRSITRLDIRKTAISGALPSPFLCLPPDVTNPNVPTNPKYLFDKVFTNYNTTYQGLCIPNITSISPYPLQINSTITLSGNNIAGVNGYYLIKMSNTVGDQVNINCIMVDGETIVCTNGQIQGEGTLNIQIFNGNNPPPQDSIDFAYQAPLILSATPCPTLGGNITLTGYDLVDPVGIQENSGIVILGKRCENIQIIVPYRVVSCYYPPGIVSNVPISFKVKGLMSTNSSVNFFYKAPYVISSNAILPNVESDLIISGSDFWNDKDLITVTIGPNQINCPVSLVNHNIIICRFPATPYVTGSMSINVTVLSQSSQPNGLFQFIDENLCPKSCSGKGVCSVSVGFCICEDLYGPACTQTPIQTAYELETGTPLLTISAENNKTQLQATLVSVIENGAETLIPSNWIVTQNDTYAVYNWTSKMIVTIRKNVADGSEQLGGLNYTYPANSYAYSVEYTNTLMPSPSLQFKFSIKVIPEECEVPPMTLAYPTTDNSSETQSADLHWSLLTQYQTQWSARYPQSANVNSGYGSVKSRVLSQTGSSQILLVTVLPGTAQQEDIFETRFEMDFTAYQATDSRTPGGSCKGSSSEDNRWKIAVGVVVGVVGAAIFAVLLFYIFRQKTKLDETKRLLDKKLAELNGL
ncbi:hypothetical protein PPL_02158 [Heterostelium album PN500]|uniref:IPT/TIG domain-containing protein n=1 Tax=Heterostelium pallidum (strain ATCC 26659 / Pp 5 / PN500) TaxID=670386 RepID=D3B1I4_HETP5|nr:hypothetical protein PPL_02158 [Heterostelium album PN500]EFA85158.1 hypothetical protein PPL_02158 [Heterostelium album PN500]|eukprot:XP_020437267.1 hypothetical protein PPL_02158 [Heterostelium album PN500]